MELFAEGIATAVGDGYFGLGGFDGRGGLSGEFRMMGEGIFVGFGGR